jgi:hypothetical protein
LLRISVVVLASNQSHGADSNKRHQADHLDRC